MICIRSPKNRNRNVILHETRRVIHNDQNRVSTWCESVFFSLFSYYFLYLFFFIYPSFFPSFHLRTSLFLSFVSSWDLRARGKRYRDHLSRWWPYFRLSSIDNARITLTHTHRCRDPRNGRDTRFLFSIASKIFSTRFSRFAHLAFTDFPSFTARLAHRVPRLTAKNIHSRVSCTRGCYASSANGIIGRSRASRGHREQPCDRLVERNWRELANTFLSRFVVSRRFRTRTTTEPSRSSPVATHARETNAQALTEHRVFLPFVLRPGSRFEQRRTVRVLAVRRSTSDRRTPIPRARDDRSRTNKSRKRDAPMFVRAIVLPAASRADRGSDNSYTCPIAARGI